MGYFSNSTEGMAYEATYCRACLHYPGEDAEDMCPVWKASFFYNGDKSAEPVLDVLIPRLIGGDNAQCTMFVEKPGQVPWE